MTHTVDFQPFANGVDANVETQGDYLTDLADATKLGNGLLGNQILLSTRLNKILRQSSMTSAALANAISNILGIDVLDDGSLSTLTANLQSALSKAAVGKQTMNFEARRLTPRSANGCSAIATSNGASDQPDVDYLAFAQSVKTYAQFVIPEMPKRWDLQPFTVAFKWRRGSGTSAANVVWGARALAIRNGDSPVANFGSDATVTAPAQTTTANFALPADTAALTPGGTPAAQCAMFIEVFRDGASGSDTMGSDPAWLSGISIHYTSAAGNDT
jgi:hypothetical protein